MARRLSIVFLIAFTSTVLRADQPPEILNATAPYSAILNLGATNSALLANASVCDAAGNFYVTGSFEGIARFGTNVLNSSGGFNFDDIYVVKYDPAGNVLWAKRAGGSGTDYGRAITLDGAGGVYVAGTSDSLPCTIGTNSIGNYGTDMFIARFDGNGNVLWAQRGGPWLKNFSVQGGVLTVKGIARDPANNVIIAGSFTGNPSFGGSLNGQSGSDATFLTNHNTSLPTGYQDTYLAKFDASGSLLWAINPGGADDDYANALAVDSTGAIYTSGGFNRTNILGGQTYTNSFEGMFLAKFSGAGDLVWSSNLSDATNSNPGHGLALTVDASDRVTLSFQANNSSQPFNFRGTNFALAFGAINLLAQFDVNGNLFWLNKIGFLTGGSTLTVDKQNNLYVGGIYQPNVTIVMGLLKMNSNGAPLWTNSVPQLGLPSASVDDVGITHVSTTVVGEVGTYFTVGWTNIYPGFGGFGKDAIIFAIASNFVAVPPLFLQQPTNMVYQPPKGLTNSALARAWPAPRYYWYMSGLKLAVQTNFFLALGPTGFTNQTSYFVVASNSYGMATSIVVNAQAAISFASSPATNINVLIGNTLNLTGLGAGTTPVSYQWRFQGTNIVNATGTALTVPNIALNQAGTYTLIISNAAGALTSTPPSTVTVVLPGFIDPGFTNQPASPLDLLRWRDGSYYVAQGSILHLNANGGLDATGPWSGLTGSGVWALARESDTQFVAAGIFAGGIARYNTNGTIDSTFNIGTGAANTVEGSSFTRINSLIRLTNGQYLAAGRFNRFNGIAYTNLVRLNTNGSVDLTFPSHSILYSSAPAQGQGEILRIVLQGDGKILAGGEFQKFDGLSVSNLVRLNADGTLDGTFAVSPVLKAPPFGRVHAMLPLAGGKILVGGAWGNGTNAGVARLLANGDFDPTFNGPATTAPTHAMVLINNKLIVGGQNFLKRVSYDGILDTNFTTGSFFNSSQTEVMLPEPGGNVIVGGSSYGVRRLWLEPTPIVVPTFSSGSGVTLVNGQFQLSACGGVDGQNVVVQTSSDLVNWVSVSTNVVSGGCISYTDPQTPAPPNRYYRLMVP